LPVARRISLAIEPHPLAILGSLFFRAWLISTIQSAGVYLAAHLHPAGLVTAFLISYLWAGNSQAINGHRGWLARVAYGCGGAGGFLTTLGAAWLLG
jgi:hypothetical protein